MDLIAGFKGINNRVDPTALGMEWQLGADNALCDNAKYLVQRPGYAEFATSVADAFGTRDGRLFVVSSTGVLYEVAADGASRARTTGFSGAPFQWAELGSAIFAMSETTAWCIYPDRVVPWGVPMADIPTLSATAGDAGFTLTVNGSGFVSDSVVQWNGASRTTTYVSATQLTAAIPATDIAAAGTASVTVFNPAPGGGTSNAQSFTIVTQNVF